MGYYPIELDKTRNLRYDMRAIDRVEKRLNSPFMKIQGMEDGTLTMEQYAVVIWAGLAHEDKSLSPKKVMDLIDEHSSLRAVTKEMWAAINEAFGTDEEVDEQLEEEEKNE